MTWKSFAGRLAAKLTSRKLWGFLTAVALVVFVGERAGWDLGVNLGIVVIPVALAVLTGGVAYEKRYAQASKAGGDDNDG